MFRPNGARRRQPLRHSTLPKLETGELEQLKREGSAGSLDAEGTSAQALC